MYTAVDTGSAKFLVQSTKWHFCIITQLKGNSLKYHKLDPDRCVQSVFSLRNKSVGLSCGLSLGAGFAINGTCQTRTVYFDWICKGSHSKIASHIVELQTFSSLKASLLWQVPTKNHSKKIGGLEMTALLSVRIWEAFKSRKRKWPTIIVFDPACLLVSDVQNIKYK